MLKKLFLIMILIYPPVSKICEPPAGLALLSGALNQHGIKHQVIDASVEAMLWLANVDSAYHCNHSYDSQAHKSHHNAPRSRYIPPEDSWTKRALKHLSQSLIDLRNQPLYKNEGRYRQRVLDVNRVITTRLSSRFKISLSDYTDSELAPVKSRDLLICAERFQENPFCGFFEDFLFKKIEEFSPQHVGISLCYLSQAMTAFALAGWLKSRFPGIKIIMGGGLVTSWMRMPSWNNPFAGLIDKMIQGRGEQSIVEIAGGEPGENQRYVPDYDFCPWDKYLAPGRILPYRTAVGCYWSKCRFCPEKVEGGKYIPGKNKDMLRDMLRFSTRYKPDHVHFVDDAVSPSFMKALTLNPLNATWYGFVRFTRALADREFCRALYRSGCRMLKLGLESGDQGVLEKMNKGTDLRLASRVLSALKEAGIYTYVYLLFGTEFENERAAEKTLDYVAAHSGCISYLNVAVFNLPKFSEDAANLETRPFYGGDLSLYESFKHPMGWDRNMVRRFLDKRFRKHPAIAPVLRRDPPFFTSNHAMFLDL